jgi:arylsulfatase A-like enzyme
VPLIFHLPGRIVAGESEALVSLLDLLPTLADFSRGLRTDPAWEGRSLAPLLRGEAAGDLGERELFAEVSFVADVEDVERKTLKTAFKTALLTAEGLKLIHDLSEGSWELYDLRSDPAEKHNLWGTEGSERRLRKVLLTWEKSRRRRANDPGKNLLPTAEDIERLRSLGYIQ